ncbi:phosphatase 2C-like domain-containing protein [Dichotomopilus funicola]|uniref:Phosphatase 2C-like domain-containing protein n=1 Tax=Dichotomopilus funicola TaxID=1934379 RepID=A0AAN6V087_9PEZI|nr:phosphatase 2C-like domain-containing protein [Dichotomopilus funicola]
MRPLCIALRRPGNGIPLQPNKFYRYYTRGPSSTPPTHGNTTRYAALVGVASAAAGFWWMTTTRRDQVPQLDNPLATHLAIQPGPSEASVSRMLSQGAYSFPVKGVPGVNRYDGAQVASNSPCEDRFTHGKFPSPRGDGSQWMAWAVFDGHAGWQTADLLEKQLLPFVRYNLNQSKAAMDDESAAVEAVQRAVTQGFLSLDNSIMKTALDISQSAEPLQDKVRRLTPGHAGSCALLSIYDPVLSVLHVACTGDSRAVLGQKRPDGTWEAIALSVDQTGTNPEEVARLSREHPGEKNIVKDGRVLGIMVSRAFGDGRWKWPLELQEDLKRRFYGPPPLTPKYDIRTPPYLTAEPVMTATKIEPGKPAFLITATDGLWDNLSNQQAVELVGKWLELKESDKGGTNPVSTRAQFDFSQFRTVVSRTFVEERTTIQDNNAAVHLVRNSLGGNHHELVAARLAFDSPFSRRVRDDITVQIVFFANNQDAA